MIDIHTHILPGVDDGSKSVECSEEMLRQLQSQGVDRVVLTSHYYGIRRSQQQFLESREKAYARLRDRVPQGMTLYLGAEVHFSSILTAAKCEKLTIANSRYLLLELPYVSRWKSDFLSQLRRFINESDFVPVVAHFCRYEPIYSHPEILFELADMGCLLQVNADAMFEKRSSKLVKAAFKHGLVHCLGSDCHNMGERAPRYASAVEKIKEWGFAEQAEKLQENMANILADKQVDRGTFSVVKKFLGSYR